MYNLRIKLHESLITEGDVFEMGDDKIDKSERNVDTGKKDYSDIINALDKTKNPTAPTQVGVMKCVGIMDDKDGVNRSLFGKKLHQEKNEDGSYYQFDDKELVKVRRCIKNR